MPPRLAEELASPDPYEQLARWLSHARRVQPVWYDAVVLATADARGTPSARGVLLRGLDRRGIVFFTDRRSRKGRELAANPRGALVFLWSDLRRQVRVEGKVAPISEEESDAYFAGRPRGSRVAAWASRQDEPISDRGVLERQVLAVERRFRRRTVPRPPYWCGYRLLPSVFEF